MCDVTVFLMLTCKKLAVSEKWMQSPVTFLCPRPPSTSATSGGKPCALGPVGTVGAGALGPVGPVGTVEQGPLASGLVVTGLLPFSERVHSDQEEVQVPVLQLLGHAPVHPEAAHALPHGRAALPLRHLWEEVHTTRAHEAAHTGEWCGAQQGTPGPLLGSALHPAGVQPLVQSATESPEVRSTPTPMDPSGL